MRILAEMLLSVVAAQSKEKVKEVLKGVVI